MGLVRIQFATELKPALLAHLREHVSEIAELSNEELYERWLDDFVDSLGEHFLRYAGKIRRQDTSDSFVFVESRWTSSHRHLLGYTDQLQDWPERLPYEDDDVPREVLRSPHWLRRVIVLVWRPVGF